jgi:hypothetical protein
MSLPAFQPKQSQMRSAFDSVDMPTNQAFAGGKAALMTKTTKTA